MLDSRKVRVCRAERMREDSRRVTNQCLPIRPQRFHGDPLDPNDELGGDLDVAKRNQPLIAIDAAEYPCQAVPRGSDEDEHLQAVLGNEQVDVLRPVGGGCEALLSSLPSLVVVVITVNVSWGGSSYSR